MLFEQAFRKTEKQQLAWRRLREFAVVLLYGGSRSGKTFLFVCAIIVRAVMAPGSDHIILRRTYRDCRRSIFNKTLKEALQVVMPKGQGKVYQYNQSESSVTFYNGSQIFCEGLNDDRIESILGNEYATIFFNEVSEISYPVIETVRTRLAQIVNRESVEIPLAKKIFMDCNPPKRRHWVHRIFFDKTNPEDGSPLPNPDDYTALQINPVDNIDHLGADYIEKELRSLSRTKRKRFLDGEFGDDTEGALWQQSWIDRNRAKWDPTQRRFIVPDCSRVVVAVDPSVTAHATSDEVGIIIAGKWRNPETGEDEYYIRDDRSSIMAAAEWGAEAVAALDAWAADRIVGEVNQGGDLVELNIRNIRRNVPYKAVRATRGKAVRAEPVAALYERGLVHHVGIFEALEDELTSWVADDPTERSPNRLDALVWAISDLMQAGTGTMSVPSVALSL